MPTLIPFNSLTAELIAARKNSHEICRTFAKSPSKGNLKRLKTLFGHCVDKIVTKATIVNLPLNFLFTFEVYKWKYS